MLHCHGTSAVCSFRTTHFVLLCRSLPAHYTVVAKSAVGSFRIDDDIPSSQLHLLKVLSEEKHEPVLAQGSAHTLNPPVVQLHPPA